ncbi:t-SNARE [Phyllosticta citribraziliensis]|uniref:t-SNARE n=1 Tax=Phyllosticta citribraziliensis TaxID=989973 RepID=A0ABR1L385_9PEZI
MSYGGYNQYGGNPYEQDEAANPYGQPSPYAAQQPPPLTHQQASNYSQPSQYSEIPMAEQGTATQSQYSLSDQDFLGRVGLCGKNIELLTTRIGEIATIHQRLLNDANEAHAQAQLKTLTTDTQILNTKIKDEIRFLEADAMRSGNNSTKNSHSRRLKNTFQEKLHDYQVLEKKYSDRYRDQIRRQYRIVKPDATEEEVEAAANEDWNQSGGLFQTALKTNRSGQANSVLGAVRARHNDIEVIEKTMNDLAQLFIQLNEAVVLQQPQVEQTEQKTEAVLEEGKQANVQLDKGIDHIRRRNRLRRWTLFIFILIVCIIALVVGLYFGLNNKKNNNNNNNP